MLSQSQVFCEALHIFHLVYKTSMFWADLFSTWRQRIQFFFALRVFGQKIKHDLYDWPGNRVCHPGTYIAHKFRFSANWFTRTADDAATVGRSKWLIVTKGQDCFPEEANHKHLYSHGPASLNLQYTLVLAHSCKYIFVCTRTMDQETGTHTFVGMWPDIGDAVFMIPLTFTIFYKTSQRFSGEGKKWQLGLVH